MTPARDHLQTPALHAHRCVALQRTFGVEAGPRDPTRIGDVVVRAFGHSEVQLGDRFAGRRRSSGSARSSLPVQVSDGTLLDTRQRELQALVDRERCPTSGVLVVRSSTRSARRGIR